MPPVPETVPKSEINQVEACVFETILARILDGEYGPNARLPAERALAEQLGASRISLRGALARLESQGLIEIQPGSGTMVQQRRYWSFGALSAYVRRCARNADVESLARIVQEILALRRFLMADIVCSGLRRPVAGELDSARQALLRAWDARDSIQDFLRLDLEKSRRVLEATEMLCSLWLLNTTAQAYLDFAQALGSELLITDDYVDFHLSVFALLEKGDTENARRLSRDYLDRQDAAILKGFGKASLFTSAPVPI